MSRITISLALFFALAGPAQAGSIELYASPPSGNRYDTGIAYYIFTAAPGEQNDITVERAPGGGVRLTDTAALPSGCPADGPNAVVCERGIDIYVKAGDGDDRVLAGDRTLFAVDGGAGNDRLVSVDATSLGGGPGNDVLEGGPGDDSLSGGPGRDRMTGGGGNDRLFAADGDADRLDGGDGTDAVSYTDSAVGVRVDLARAAGPDGDVLTNIEDVDGGRGRDVLLGDDGPNEIEGGGAADRIHGRGGDDRLDGFAGDDTLLGGAGDDTLEGAPGRDRLDGGPGADRFFLLGRAGGDIRCGAGRDTLYATLLTGVPRVHRDCETFEGEGPIVRITSTRLILRWNSREYRRPCRIQATVGGRETILRRFNGATLPLARPATVRLRPSSRCRGAFGTGYERTAFRLV